MSKRRGGVQERGRGYGEERVRWCASKGVRDGSTLIHFGGKNLQDYHGIDLGWLEDCVSERGETRV